MASCCISRTLCIVTDLQISDSLRFCSSAGWTSFEFTTHSKIDKGCGDFFFSSSFPEGQHFPSRGRDLLLYSQKNLKSNNWWHPSIQNTELVSKWWRWHRNFHQNICCSLLAGVCVCNQKSKIWEQFAELCFRIHSKRRGWQTLSQTGHIHSRISPEHLTQSLLQSWLLGLTCLWVSCGAGWWHFKPSWQGVRVPTFRLNGATRQMILTATHPSAFDSIKRCEVASTLSEELSKVPLISSSRMSTRRCSFNLYTPLNIAGPYVNCHWECLLVAWHRCSGIHLQRGLETEVMWAICVWQKHFCFNFLFIRVCSASNSDDRTRTLLPALALTLGLLYYKCIKFNEIKDLGLWRYFTCIFANFSLCISDGWEE